MTAKLTPALYRFLVELVAPVSRNLSLGLVFGSILLNGCATLPDSHTLLATPVPVKTIDDAPAMQDGRARFREVFCSNMRAAEALTVSLVAELDSSIIGHIAFSPVIISDGTQNWYGLGPISVSPEYQRQGIGRALIVEGLSRLKVVNAKGCCLVGHP